MSSANRTSIGYSKEVQWGVNPGTQLQEIDFESEGLNFKPKFTKSNSIDPSRKVKDIIQTGAETGGDIGIELQADGYDDFIAAALFTEWVKPTDGFDIVSGSAATNRTIIMDATGGAGLTDITFGSAIVHNLVVGQNFSLIGASATNNKIYTVTNVAGQVIRVTPDVAFSETLDETDAATVTAGMVRDGIETTSFYIEKEHADISQIFQYLGMTVDQMTLDFNESSIITGKFTFVGKNASLEQTTGGTGTNLSAPLTPKFNTSADIGNVVIDGVAAAECLVKQITMEVKNNLEGNGALGVLGFCKVTEGECDISGKISMYFLDNTMYDRYIASTPFSFSMVISDATGKGYKITLPKLKLTDDAVNASGKNSNVLEDAAYQALVGTSGYTIQIDKIRVVV